MKKPVLILLTFFPLLVGWLINASFNVPSLFRVAYYLLPLLTLVFWFLLGKQYARTDWPAPLAILIGNATGLVSLLLYLWQFVLVSGAHRNLFLAVLSQLFTASVPTYLFGGLLTAFEPDPSRIGIVSMVTVQVLGVLLMLAVFSLGYGAGRLRRRSEFA